MIMKEFDKIIGYSAIKKELEQIADILRNGEVYAKLGVSAPRGLLLHGAPGLGKTLMAGCLIKHQGASILSAAKTNQTEILLSTLSKFSIKLRKMLLQSFFLTIWTS